MQAHTDDLAYGTISLSDYAPGRPILAFAILAYNQEKFIREAVDGALSQSYKPLQIILSDDCSTDSTYEIMLAMAGAYKGPHRIVVRKNAINLGTAQHLYAVSQISSSELLIVAAGDDVSAPERSSVIARSWIEGGKKASCIHSGAYLFTADTKRSTRIVPRSKSITTSKGAENELLCDRLPFLSPTCAYSSKLFLHFGPLIGGSFIEDGPMAMRALSTGPLIAINSPLVYIRKQPHTSGTGYSIRDPERWNRLIRSRIISCLTRLQDCSLAQIDGKLRRRLEVRLIRKARSLSNFLVVQDRQVSVVCKVLFFIRYTLLYPGGKGLLRRSSDAAKIVLDPSSLKRLKQLVQPFIEALGLKRISS